MDYSIHLISNKPETYDVIQQGLYPEKLNYFDGTGYPSFAKLINSCVAASPTETVIIVADKVRPTPAHVKQVLELLNVGYAFVGLYMYGFFGFKKELFRTIGPFDERYVGGGFEDYDYNVRMLEADLAFFITKDVPYIANPSSWTRDGKYPGYDFWTRKWYHIWVEGNEAPVRLERTLHEEQYDYDFGPRVPTTFLSAKKHCYTTCYEHTGVFMTMQITNSPELK